MPLRRPNPNTPDSTDVRASFSDLRALPSVHWPDDCHACGTRMAFAFDPETEGISHRLCPACGATAHAESGPRGCRIVLSGVAAEVAA